MAGKEERRKGDPKNERVVEGLDSYSLHSQPYKFQLAELNT